MELLRAKLPKYPFTVITYLIISVCFLLCHFTLFSYDHTTTFTNTSIQLTTTSHSLYKHHNLRLELQLHLRVPNIPYIIFLKINNFRVCRFIGTPISWCIASTIWNQLDKCYCGCCLIWDFAFGKWSEVFLCNLVWARFLVSYLNPKP